MAIMTDRHATHLGRRVIVDSRDLWYLLADQAPEVFTQPLATRGRVVFTQPPATRGRVLRGPVYDQGSHPWAVSCALLANLHASPRKIGVPRTPTVEILDRLIREIEGATGPSVTVRSGCKALKRLGLITGYAWSYEASEVRDWLLSGRGITLGLDWYEMMDQPDEQGLIRAWGRPAGEHAVFAFGYDLLTDTVLLQNSRGPDWGGWSTRPGRRDFRGCARLPLSDLNKLLVDNGEAVALAKNPDWRGMP